VRGYDFWLFFVLVIREIFFCQRTTAEKVFHFAPGFGRFFCGYTRRIFLKGDVFIAKTNRCVVRNQAYRRGEFNIRERHNERKNESYGNGDILPERSNLNVHFKSCPSTYEQEFNRMVESGAVSLRGLKADAKVFDELVFDVNSAYFENHGGYDYAKQFFAEAYKLAVKEAGGEEYVLSAVLHADERNKALSDQLGCDIFHYHLHVIYVPVVGKEIYFKKNNKDPELAGKLKEVVKQVSHSKKWPRFRDENGQWVNSYSLLQDRFYEHMRAAGYVDFERGERGSTAEHLTVLEYKTQQETERAAVLNEKAEKTQRQLYVLEKKTAVVKREAATFAGIEGMTKPARFGGSLQISPADWETVSGLAKEGVRSRSGIAKLKEKNTELSQKVVELKKRLAGYEGMGISEEIKYYQARQRAPRRLAEAVSDILRQPPERQEQKRKEPQLKRSDMER